MHIHSKERSSRTHAPPILTLRRVISDPCLLIVPVTVIPQKRLDEQLSCPLRFFRQFSVPALGRLLQQKWLTLVVLGLVRSFYLVSERLDPLESFVGPVFSSIKLGDLCLTGNASVSR